MGKRRLIWQIFPSYILVILASLLAITFYTSQSVREFYREQMRAALQSRAALLQPQVAELLRLGQLAEVDPLCKRLGKLSEVRITVVLPSGEVVGDTATDPATMENHGDRFEVVQALAGATETSLRFSETVGQQTMYVAAPVYAGDKIVGAVRVAIPTTVIDDELWAFFVQMSVAGAVVALLAATISWLVSRRITRPLEELKHAAERFAQGDLRQRLPVPNSFEIAGLAEAMNEMAEQLDDRMRTLFEQSNEQEAVLSSMVEGVFAVDNTQRIISINQAAARLVGADALIAHGRNIADVVNNPALHEFAVQALASSQPVEGEIRFRKGGDQILQAHGAVLRDAHGKGIGAVIVLNDVSHLRRLEQIRQDFVANVSHELKTPITSIKGFVETLLNGNLDNHEDTERFLKIVAKQADRLNAIIEDLLTLSRLEQGADAADDLLHLEPLRQSLVDSVQLCSPAAGLKGVRIDVECDDGIQARINPPLIEQGIVNLLDNAIKYSPDAGCVRLSARQSGGEVIISVEDDGSGVPEEHQARIFERFYRVDKARSRSLGGTGLGLAIVRHIAQTHGGTASVKSAPGKGSTFSIHLPLPRPA